MSYLPNERHLSALAAAIGSPKSAADAYVKWRRDGHELDTEETRIAPIIAANVSPLLTDDEWLREAHSARRLTLMSHLRRLANCSRLSDALQAKGIESLWLKGVGMLAWYPDISVRTMFDADLCVPWSLRHEAIDVLAACGFWPSPRTGMDEMHAVTDKLHAWGMRDAGGNEIDVHWRSLFRSSQPEVDAALFSAAEVATIASVKLAIPNPSHHLALVLAHGMREMSRAHLISLVDACHLLRAPGFDPNVSAQLASRYERTSALIDACAVLECIDLPLDLQESVSSLRRSLRRRTIGDRLAARLAAAPDTPDGPIERRRALQTRAWRALTTTPLRRGGPVVGLLDVAREWIDVPRVRNIPGELLWRASGRPAVLERLRAPRGIPREQLPALVPGDQVRVGRTESLSNVLPRGWSTPEGEIVWSDGPEAVIDFRLDLGGVDECSIAVEAIPHLPSEFADLTVHVRINRRRVTTWRYSGDDDVIPRVRRIKVTERMLDDGCCQIMLIFRGTSRPIDYGHSDDARRLGLAFVSLTAEADWRQSVVRADVRRR